MMLSKNTNHAEENIRQLVTAKALCSQIERMREPIIVTIDGIIVAFNEAAEELWGDKLESLKCLLGEEIEYVINHFNPSEEQQCFFALSQPITLQGAYIH